MLDEFAQERVVIYGAGADGRSLCRALLRNGIVPALLIDLKAERIHTVEGIPVRHPDRVAAEGGRDIAFIALSNQRFYKDASATLQRLGFCDIRNGLELLVALNANRCGAAAPGTPVDAATCLTCQAQFYRCPLYENAVMKAAPNSESEIVVPYVALIISTRCVHKCRDCHAAIPYLTPMDFELTTLLQYVSQFLSHVKCVHQLGIGSGEVFLYKHLPELLDLLSRDGRIGSIHLTTTGAVAPGERLAGVLDNPKICISISDYGDALRAEMGSRRMRFVDGLRERRKPFRYNRSLTWFDLGGHRERQRTLEGHQRVFRSCEFRENGNVIFDGRLYHCTRTYTHDMLGLVPAVEGDYVDLRDGYRLSARLKRFYSTQYLTTCRFCDGTGACREIPAGIQLEKAS